MKAPEHANNARHAATLTGVSGGRAYQANGEAVGNVLWTDGTGTCVISIMPDAGEYVNAWHALSRLCGKRRQSGWKCRNKSKAERIFEFKIEGEDSRDMKAWRDQIQRAEDRNCRPGWCGTVDSRPYEQDVRQMRLAFGMETRSKDATFCGRPDGQARKRSAGIRPNTLVGTTNDSGRESRFIPNTGGRTNTRTCSMRRASCS